MNILIKYFRLTNHQMKNISTGFFTKFFKKYILKLRDSVYILFEIKTNVKINKTLLA